MSVRFFWDPVKARRNQEKHGVSFDEASTVFGDRFAGTISDEDHSMGEFRYVTIGCSKRGRLLVVVHLERENEREIRIVSAREATAKERKSMKAEDDDDIRPEYDFTNAVRGKYYERYQEGTNVVLLEPDVAAAFPDSEAVNEALRSLLRIAMRATSSSGR